MASEKLKIFISWSGQLSRAVATALREWLPEVFDNVEPWMSASDIDAGAKWDEHVSRELDESHFGIIVVTSDNQHAPWLNFEAGALSKRFGINSQAYVAPLLVDLESPSQVSGPMTRFQISTLDPEGLEKVITTIGKVLGVDQRVAARRLSLTWPDLQSRIAESTSRINKTKHAVRPTTEMLDEVVGGVRELLARVPKPHPEDW